MDKLHVVWDELTLGPVSVFSALFMAGSFAFLILAHRNVRFKWGIYLAMVLALIRMPVVRYKRELLDDHDGGFVVGLTFGTFIFLILIWTLVWGLNKLAGRSRV